MQDYVLIFVQDGERFLVIEKHKPDWMKGKFNLVGGKVEKHESSIDAAHRELKEETGFVCDQMEYFGLISGSWGSVHCYKAGGKIASSVGDLTFQPGDDEVETLSWRNISFLYDRNLMPNLRAIIPLMICGVRNWSLLDEGSSLGVENHQFLMSVPSFEHKSLKFAEK